MWCLLLNVTDGNYGAWKIRDHGTLGVTLTNSLIKRTLTPTKILHERNVGVFD